MAEIEIQKKKPVWPWVVLVILIILAILYFFVFDDDDYVDDGNDVRTEQIDENAAWNDNQLEDANNSASFEDNNFANGGVAGFVEYIGNESKMGVDHEYTNKALFYLIDAVEETAMEANVDIRNNLNAVKERAREITQNPSATDHAGTIRDTGMQITEIIKNIQEERFPSLNQEMEEMRTAVQEIQPDELTLNQKEAVNSFFKEAADVLQKMNS